MGGKPFSTRCTLFDAPLPRERHFLLRPPGVLGLLVLTIWVGSSACLYTNESRLIFRASGTRFPPPEPGPGLTHFQTRDGLTLDALSLTHGEAAGYWILFCPPSGRTIHGRVRRQLEWLHDSGFNVFAFDYRGFGRNAGTPSETGVYEDALAAYRHLTKHLDVPPRRIILAGRSLGLAVAVELSTRVPSAGLFLMSAIESVPATASRFYFWAPVSLLASQRFDSIAKAPRVTVPVLQVHASSDWLVPLDHARALFGRFPGRKVLFELPGGHNDVGLADEALTRALRQFWADTDRPSLPLRATH